MAYKSMKKNKAYIRALHRPQKAKRKREEKEKAWKEFVNKREEKEKAWKEFVNKLSPPFISKYQD